MAKILVVDDEPMLTEAYCTILEHAGHQTKPAYDGEQALTVAKQFKPDVILLDLLMPKKDGIGFLKDFSRIIWICFIYFFVICGKQRMFPVKFALHSPAIYFIVASQFC